MPHMLHDLKQTIASGLKSNTLTTCSRWAAHRRIMGEPFAGPYTWTYHPWVREMHDSRAGFNYAMKGAQLGVTEVAINRAFYVLDQLKRDVLYVLPTAINASDFSKARFGPALRNSPYLANLFTDTNTVNLKQAGINNLYIRGSRGDSNLKSIPVSELILDEVDEMDQKQIWLALERLSGQPSGHRFVWGISTPTIPNYGIHKLYQSSTQEHFVFECPSCSRSTELIWPDCITIIGEAVNDPRCAESYLICKECKNRLPHEEKPLWLKNAQWVASNVNGNPDVRGFHISQLYSFTVTPGDLVVAYFRGVGDEAANKEFHNSKLGLPYIGEGAKVNDDLIDQCIGNHTMADPTYPRVGGERVITLGVDQGKWSYYTVVEWLFDKPSSDLNVSATAKVLYHGKFFETDWHILDQLMVEWQILACVIDADPEINQARRFAKSYQDYVYLCRYRRGQVAKEISIVDKESGSPIATVDRTNWLSATLGRFKTKRIILPRDVTFEYREHMKNLVRTYEKDELGNYRATFVDTGPDHYAHSLNYAEIGLPLAVSFTTGQDVEKFL